MKKLNPNQAIVTFVKSFPRGAEDIHAPRRRVFISENDHRGNPTWTEDVSKAQVTSVDAAFATVADYRRTYGGDAMLARIDVLGFLPETEDEIPDFDRVSS